jgi:hypothetical protein
MSYRQAARNYPVYDKRDKAPDLRWFILRAKEQKNRVGVYINRFSLALLVYLLGRFHPFFRPRSPVGRVEV